MNHFYDIPLERACQPKTGNGTIKGIFFDLHGTLCYGDMSAAESHWIKSSLHGYLKTHGIVIPKEELYQSCKDFFSKPEPPAQAGLSVFECRLQALFAGFGLNVDTGELHRIAAILADACQEHLSFDAEAIPVLQALARSKKLALISNYDHPAHIHSVLQRTGLKGFFDSVVISGEVGAKKPNPIIFTAALEETQLRPSEVVYVGDDWGKDVQGAYAARIRPILIMRDDVASDQRLESIDTIFSLSELVEMFC